MPSKESLERKGRSAESIKIADAFAAKWNLTGEQMFGMADLRDEAIRDEVEALATPYPEDIFTPLADCEAELIQEALLTSGVRHASDRLHASWARHLSVAR